MGRGQVLAKPKAEHASDKFTSRWELVSISFTFVTGLQPTGCSRRQIVICLQLFYWFLLFFCDGFVFETLLIVFREHMLETF